MECLSNGKSNIGLFSGAAIRLAFWLYNLIWELIIPLLRFNHRLAEGFKQRILKDYIPKNADLWIQAASVGESFLAWELLKNLKPKAPIKAMLTSTTSQGVEILKRAIEEVKPIDNKVHADVMYFPFDKPEIMKKAVNRMRPKVMVLLETELWPGLLMTLKTYACRTLVINGRLTEKSLKRYLIWPTFWKSLKPDKILAISETDAMRFAKLFGTKGVDVMPNIKFDRFCPTEPIWQVENPIANLLPPLSPFVVFGSVRKAEEPLIEKIILRIFDKNSGAVIGLFPRHTHRIAAWQQSLTRLGATYRLRSQAEAHVSPGTVLLWDTFGELTLAYGLASAAFVGGSLAPLGGQNFLEAMTCGVIPVIGPFWENFAWIGPEIVVQGLVRVAKDWYDVAQMLIEDMQNPRPRKDVFDKALLYFKDRQGGTNQACRLIVAFLEVA